jgi:H+/Cl- antiporter ClcA
MVCGARSRAVYLYRNLGSLDILFWDLFQAIRTVESKKMSNTTLLLISIFVFCLLLAGLYLMVREFMGEVRDAFPDVNEWLDSDQKKKK